MPQNSFTLLPGPRRQGRPRSAAAVGVLALLFLTGCGDAAEVSGAPSSTAMPDRPPVEGTTDTGGTSSATETTDDAAASSPDVDFSAQEVVITIEDFAFAVPEGIAPGAEVTVRNGDDVGHTVTSKDEGFFDVIVGPGEEVTFTAPQEPGEYAFYCRPHPNMVATLVVP